LRRSPPPGRTHEVVVFLATFIVATRLLAQTNTGNVYGTVHDELGARVAGATVTLTGSAAPRTANVDALGFFRFLGVAPGPYKLTVTRAGFTSFTRGNLLVSVGQNAQVDVTMKLASVEESVTVTDAAPLLDTRQVETGRTFAGAELTEIPTSRDVWSLIQQIPGVLLDTVDVAGNASAVVGGPGLKSKGSGNVAYEVDGATITGGGPYVSSLDGAHYNPLERQNGGTGMYFDFSTFDSVEATTGGSLLEQQNSGVTINVVTKRGTNQLKGSARYLYASANWQSDNTPPEAAADGQQTTETRFIREYGAELGGPIVHDRVWFWAAASRQDISLKSGVYVPDILPFPQTTILEPWSAKVNAQISNANSIALYYQKSNRLEFGVGGYDPWRPPASRTNNVIPTSFYKAEDSNVFSDSLFASIFASYQDAASTSTPIGGLDEDLEWYDGTFHNSWSWLDTHEPQKQANLQASKFFDTGRINHELKFGFNYRLQTATSSSGLPGSQNAGGDATWPGLAPTTPGTLLLSRDARWVFERQFSSFWLGDTMTTGNLTVAAGVRYDLQQAKSPPGMAFGNAMFLNPCTNCGADGGSFPGLPEVRGQGARDWQIQYSNWQPRISATYAIGEKKSTLLRASYAQFADQIGYLGYWTSTTPGQTGYNYYWTDLNHDHLVQPDEVLFNEGIQGYLNGIDPASVTPDAVPQSLRHLKTPLTAELTAGLDHQFSGDLAVSATFTYRRTTELQQHLPVGANLSTYTFLGRAQGTATGNGLSLTFDEPYFGYTGTDSGVGTVTNRPDFTQRYYGLDVSVVKQLSRNCTFRGSFGWNDFRQFLTAQSIQNPNNLWDPWTDGVGPNDNGGLASGFIDASWQFNLNGLYQGPWGLAFAVNFFGRQGYPIPYFVTVYTKDKYGTQNFLIGRIGDYRYPNLYQLDLRLQKSFLLGPVTVIPTLELFNATNAGTVLQRQLGVGAYNQDDPHPFSPYDTFNQITLIQSPRILRLGLQVNF